MIGNGEYVYMPCVNTLSVVPKLVGNRKQRRAGAKHSEAARKIKVRNKVRKARAKIKAKCKCC